MDDESKVVITYIPLLDVTVEWFLKLVWMMKPKS